MAEATTSTVELPKDVKLAPGVQIPKFKHPEKVQAIAKVMCHTAFGYHRIALINNKLVLFDHNLEREEEWQELGGKPSRCHTTLQCFKEGRLTGVPKVFYSFLEAAMRKQNKRKWARYEAQRKRIREARGGDNFSAMKRYVLLLLKYRCKYESLRKADFPQIDIHASRESVYVSGSARRAYVNEHSPNCAATPMLFALSIALPKRWKQTVHQLAMPVIDGHFILRIYHRTNDKFKTFSVQVLVEKERIDIGSPGKNGLPNVLPHKVWDFGVEWSTIQYRNGFWYLGEFSDSCYSKWRPRTAEKKVA